MSDTTALTEPELSDDAERVFASANAAITKLPPREAVGVITKLVAGYSQSLSPARTLAFTRAVAGAVTEWEKGVVGVLKRLVHGEAGSYDGFSLIMVAGRRKTDMEALEKDFPDAYAAVVSAGAPHAKITLTAEL